MNTFQNICQSMSSTNIATYNELHQLDNDCWMHLNLNKNFENMNLSLTFFSFAYFAKRKHAYTHMNIYIHSTSIGTI